MKKVSLFLIFVMAIAASSLCSAGELKIIKDITFDKVDGMEIKGDLYIPDGEGPFPGVLYIHGGGFVAGNKSYVTQVRVIKNLAENGFIVFSADYRLLSQNGIFPNNIKDAKCALCWLKKNGPEHGMIQDRVGVLGESAGGYLAAMIAVTAGMDNFRSDCELADGMDDSVIVAVPVYSPASFPKMKNNLAKLLIGEMKRVLKIKEKRELYDYMVKYSPVSYVENAVPMLLIHGVEDVLVPVEQSRIFYEALKKTGKDVEYLELENAPHGFVSDYFDSESGVTANKKAVEYLKEHLGD